MLPTLIVSLASANTVGAFTRTYNELLFAPKIQVSNFYHSLSHIILVHARYFENSFDDILLISAEFWVSRSRKIEANWWITQLQSSANARNSDLTRSSSMPWWKSTNRSRLSEERHNSSRCNETDSSLVLSLLQTSRFSDWKLSFQVEIYMSHVQRIPAFRNIPAAVTKTGTAARHWTKVLLYAFEKYLDSNKGNLNIICLFYIYQGIIRYQ